MSAVIEGWARQFLYTPRRFGVLATREPSGLPLQAVVWYAMREDGVLVNSRVGRRWPANLEREPRFSFLVHDGEDYVALRGTAVRLYDGPLANADIAMLARAYLPPEVAEQRIEHDFDRQARVSFLLRPDAVFTHR